MKRALLPAFGLAIAAVATFTAATFAEAQRRDRRMRIINNTSRTMEVFQASNVRSDSWEEDMLGDKVVNPGGYFTANINDGTGACVFDFRAKFKGGGEATKKNVNVCQIETFTFND